jgi:hypothetical protein
MKHLQKLALLAIVCLLGMSSFAQTETITPDHRFQYTGPQPSTAADRRNPANYTEVFVIPSCTRTPTPLNEVCYLAVKNSEVYTTAEVTTGDPNSLLPDSWAGLPKVDNDIVYTNTLDNAIAAAISSATDQTASSVWNVFLKRI